MSAGRFASRRSAPVSAVLFGLAMAARLWAANTPPEAVKASAPLKLTGFGQVLYSRVGEATDSFAISKARLSLESPVSRSIRFKATVDAVKIPVLIEAAIDLSIFSGGTLRLGQFKVPFSRESLVSASDHETIILPPSVLALSPGRDIGASGRDIGALVQYKAGVLEASAGLFNGSGINRADADRRKDLAARLTLAPLGRLKLGVSAYRGRSSAAGGEAPERRDRFGMELEAGLSRADIKAEWILARDGEASKRGGYVQFGVSLVADKLQAVARFDSVDTIGPLTPGGNETWTLGLNAFFAPKTKFQLNLEWRSGRESGIPSEFAFLALLQAGF